MIISEALKSVNRPGISLNENVYNRLNFKVGIFKINGAIIEIGMKDSLEDIVNKFNCKQFITGIEAKIARKNKLLLLSRHKKVDIIDYDGVLFDIHSDGMLGNSNNCMLQIVRAVGSTINYYVILSYYRVRRVCQFNCITV